MDTGDILKIIASGENERIEFKRAYTKTIVEDICAMANSEGGVILVGISDDGKLIGVENPTKIKEKITSTLVSIKPPLQVSYRVVDIDGKRILIITVPKSKKLHFIGTTAYIRVGVSKRPLDMNEILSRMVELGDFEWDAMPTELTIDSIKNEYIDMYFTRLRELRGKVITDKIRYLRSLKAIKMQEGNLYLTNGGALFFLEDPQSLFPHSGLRMIFINKNDEPISHEEFLGPLWKIADTSTNFLIKTFKTLDVVIGAKREKIIEYPVRAIREAIINALIHRNYGILADTLIFIKPTSLVIRSPGSFPPGVDLNDPIHVPRNPVLCRLMYDMGYIERYGYGIVMMRKITKSHPLVSLSFNVTPMKVEVIFKKTDYQKILDDIDQKIIALIESGVNRSSLIADNLKMSKVSILKRINRLCAIGVLEKITKGPFTYYKLTSSH